MKTYLLDTSALVALRKDEAGADQVESYLRKASRKRAHVYLSFMSFMELFYLSWRHEGKAAAHRTYLELTMLPIKRIDATEAILLRAGELKAEYTLSLADSWIAATAAEHDAILVHKDPEFESLDKQLQLQALPYKSL